MPRFQERGEALHWVMYDSKLLGASDVDATLFQDPVGSASKTLQDTNMRAAGELPSEQEFEIRAISVHAQPDITKALLVGLLTDAVLEIWIGEKPYHQVPLVKVVAACGIEGLTTGTTIELYHNGIGDPRALYTLNPTLIIEPKENFRVELHWTTAPTAVKFWVNLEGILRRAIQ